MRAGLSAGLRAAEAVDMRVEQQEVTTVAVMVAMVVAVMVAMVVIAASQVVSRAA